MKWFKHRTDAHRDVKLKKLLRKYGAEGYALYFYCIEIIAGSLDGDNITFELEDDAETLGYELKIDSLRVEEIMRYLIDLNLFEQSNGVITCLKIAKQLDDKYTRNPQLKKIITSAKLGLSPDSLGTVSGQSTDCPPLDKIRLDKTRLESKKAKAFIPPTLDDVIQYARVRNQSDFLAKKFYDYFVAGNWKDVKGQKVKNWKQKFISWENRNETSQQVHKASNSDILGSHDTSW